MWSRHSLVTQAAAINPRSLPWIISAALVMALTLTCPVAKAEVDGFDETTGLKSEPTGVELGVRAGYGNVAGRTSVGAPIRRRFAAGAPVGVELGYRLHPRWFVGGYAEYALGFASVAVQKHCPACTSSWLHLGLMVQYRVFSWERSNVWIAGALGRQTLTLGIDDERKRSRVASGPDLSLLFGGEWQVGTGIAVGPYSSISVGTFTSRVERCLNEDLCATPEKSLDLRAPGPHLWFTAGVRVAFLP